MSASKFRGAGQGRGTRRNRPFLPSAGPDRPSSRLTGGSGNEVASPREEHLGPRSSALAWGVAGEKAADGERPGLRRAAATSLPAREAIGRGGRPPPTLSFGREDLLRFGRELRGHAELQGAGERTRAPALVLEVVLRHAEVIHDLGVLFESS